MDDNNFQEALTKQNAIHRIENKTNGRSDAMIVILIKKISYNPPRSRVTNIFIDVINIGSHSGNHGSQPSSLCKKDERTLVPSMKTHEKVSLMCWNY